MLACAGTMVLDALVACAGMTLKAAATAMNVPLRGGRVSVEGDLDFRGTLAVPRRRRWVPRHLVDGDPQQAACKATRAAIIETLFEPCRE
jgi:hypothetical protein